MPTPDDERFELYLKQFRPLAPETLAMEGRGRTTRRSFKLWAGVAAAAAILVVAGALSLLIRSQRTDVDGITKNVAGEHLVTAQPLTIRSANALLARAPSFKAVVDDMAFHPQVAPLSKDQRSAVAVLSKERIKL